jgi:hypothetical protein
MKEFTVPEIKKVWIPKANHFAHFIHRKEMRHGHPIRRMCSAAVLQWPLTKLPVNNYRDFQFPMDDNDQLGICGSAAVAHADNSFTGMNGTESVFQLAALKKQYLEVSGGDNGLDDDMLINKIWKKGIAGNPLAIIDEPLDVDPLDARMMQAAIDQFGAVIFSLSVPDAWINEFDPAGGSVWHAPAQANPENGHYVVIVGVDPGGRYRVETWGSWCWLTPYGVAACDPAAFTVFSPRRFNSRGIDPTGANYTQKAAMWTHVGGSLVPARTFPNL